MIITEKYPSIIPVIEKFRQDAEEIVGCKLTIDFQFQFHRLTPDVLATIICQVCGCTWNDLIGNCRKGRFVLARHLFSYYAVVKKKITQKRTAEILGYVDHTTVCYAVKKVHDMIEIKDELYCASMDEVDEAIKNLGE